MASQIYVFDNISDLNKVKTAIVSKLKSINAVKFNDTYNVSIEGHDILTFVYTGMDDVKSNFVENAPYEHIIIINCHNISIDVVGYMTDCILDYTLCNVDIDCDNITDDHIYSLIAGSTHDYEKILKGEAELVDDYQMSSADVERIKMALEKENEPEPKSRIIRTVYHVYKERNNLIISKSSFSLAYSDLGLHTISSKDKIVVDGDIEHHFCLLEDLEVKIIGRKMNKVYFHDINSNEIDEKLLERIQASIYK